MGSGALCVNGLPTCRLPMTWPGCTRWHHGRTNPECRARPWSTHGAAPDSRKVCQSRTTLIYETVHPDRVVVAVSRCGRREISGADGIRIRLTGQLVRSTLRHLRQWEDARGLSGRNALAISPGFSMLPNVPRPSDGPDVDLVQW
jgi:hypothetical protein